MDFDLRAAGLLVLHALGDLLDVRQHAAEVAPFGGDIDIEQAA